MERQPAGTSEGELEGRLGVAAEHPLGVVVEGVGSKAVHGVVMWKGIREM